MKPNYYLICSDENVVFVTQESTEAIHELIRRQIEENKPNLRPPSKLYLIVIIGK